MFVHITINYRVELIALVTWNVVTTEKGVSLLTGSTIWVFMILSQAVKTQTSQTCLQVLLCPAKGGEQRPTSPLGHAKKTSVLDEAPGWVK